MQTIRALIHGRVQGVGFRAFVVREASARGLLGFVRNSNRRDEVEVVAHGEEHALDGLVATLRAGPRGARVDDLLLQTLHSEERFGGFAVRY